MPRVRLDLAGQKFGRLMAISRGEKDGRRTTWLCQCECGEMTEVQTVMLRRKVRPVKSCGCLVIDRTKETNTRHGMRDSREYATWQAMHDRCSNQNSKDYADYGGSGIRVAERWRSFENFLADMGPRPTGTTIERNDITGDYAPGNCRWATYREQALNRRNTVYVTLPVSVLERALGSRPGNIVRRIRDGWDPVMAIATPTQEQFARNDKKERALVDPDAQNR